MAYLQKKVVRMPRARQVGERERDKVGQRPHPVHRALSKQRYMGACVRM